VNDNSGTDILEFCKDGSSLKVCIRVEKLPENGVMSSCDKSLPPVNFWTAREVEEPAQDNTFSMVSRITLINSVVNFVILNTFFQNSV
jgi:hypothetical protein